MQFIAKIVVMTVVLAIAFSIFDDGDKWYSIPAVIILALLAFGFLF